MKVETSTVTKLLISDLINSELHLDPVTVFLEDLGQRTYEYDDKPSHISRQGKVIIECYGESWSAYWGGMGDRQVAKFFADCSVDYLSGCLVRGTDLAFTMFDGCALKEAVRRIVIGCRRGRETFRCECGHLDKDDARRLYDAADFLSSFSTTEGLMHSHTASDLLCELFSDEWHHAVTDIAFVPNQKFIYLCRIIGAVQAALRSLVPVEVAA